MKYSLTIQDLTAEKARNLIQFVEGMKSDEPTFAVDDSEKIPAFVKNQIAAADIDVDGELDADGLPWDERIHAGTKRKTAKGVWQRKKGVQDIDFDRVVEELRGSPVAPVAMPAPAPIAAPVAPVAMPAPAPIAAPVAPVAMPAPAPIAAPVAPVAITRDFQGLMRKIADLFQTKSIEKDYPQTIINRVNTGFGQTLQSVTDIANDPRMVEYAWQCLEVDGKAA